MRSQIQFGDVGEIQDFLPLDIVEQLIDKNDDAVVSDATGDQSKASPDFGINEMIFDQATSLYVLTKKDNSIRNLVSDTQFVHATGVRKACKAYWRSRSKEFESDSGRSKFEACAYLQKESVKSFDTLGKGLELSCLTSSLQSAHTKSVIDGLGRRHQ